MSGLSVYLLFAATACTDPSVRAGGPLTGDYLLIEHVKDTDALDRIEFHPDGTCKVDYNGSLGVAASYKFNRDGNMTITLDGGHAFTYGMKKQRVGMLLSQDDQANLYYGLLPDVPRRSPSMTWSAFMIHKIPWAITPRKSPPTIISAITSAILTTRHIRTSMFTRTGLAHSPRE